MQKIKNIFLTKAFENFTLISILFFALFVRFIGIYKADGLWLDELTNYYNAKEHFPFGIITATFEKGNDGPLYSFVLHIWMKIFGEHDLIIRFLPLLFSIITIYIIYLIAKWLHSHKTGILAAFLMSINSFHIYYSQEARLYSFSIFLVCLSILFLVKVKDSPCFKNYLGLFLSNLAILFTFLTGLIFVFGELGLFSIYLYINKREHLKKVLYLSIFQLSTFLPYLIILSSKLNGENSFLRTYYTAGTFDWLLTLQNFFSPVMTGIYGPNPSYYKNIFSHGIPYQFIFFAFLPIVIYLIPIIKGTFKKNLVWVISFTGVLYYLVITLEGVLGKIVFSCRHAILALPCLIIVASYGFSQIKNKIVSYSLISILVSINVFYIFASPGSAPKIPRAEGFRTVGNLLNNLNINSKDSIIMPYGYRYITKYFAKSHVSKMHIFDLTLTSTIGRIVDPKYLSGLTQDNCYIKLKDYIRSEEPSKVLEIFIKKDTLDRVEKGRFVVVILSPMIQNIYDDKTLKIITDNQNLYKNQPIFYLLASKTMNDLFKILNKNHFKIVSTQSTPSWRVLIFQKF